MYTINSLYKYAFSVNIIPDTFKETSSYKEVRHSTMIRVHS